MHYLPVMIVFTGNPKTLITDDDDGEKDDDGEDVDDDEDVDVIIENVQ